MPTPSPIELTEAEWSIIKAVWEQEPATAPDVQSRLLARTRWTYSTVRTLMDRMVIKGLLTAEKVRHLTFYRSAISRQQAQQSELHYALKHAFDGALAPMVQCLIDSEEVSPAELAELERLIRARKRRTPQP
jgi:BlaI family penicillinase repressor